MTVTESPGTAETPEPIVALGRVAAPGPHVLAGARSKLATRLATAPRSAPSRSRRSAVVVAAAIATAAAVSAPFVLPLGANGKSASGGATIKTVTPAASTAARGALLPPIPDGRHAAWWYTKTIYRNGTKAPVVRQIWLSPTNGGRLLDPGVSPHQIYLTSSIFGSVGTKQQLVSWEMLWTLPTDPAKLTKLLREGSAGAGHGPDDELFVVVGDMLHESPAPEALRAALFQVASHVAGARRIEGVKDSQGRIGIAVDRTSSEGRTTRYLFDPNDFRLLATSDGGWSATYVAEGPVKTDHSTL